MVSPFSASLNTHILQARLVTNSARYVTLSIASISLFLFLRRWRENAWYISPPPPALLPLQVWSISYIVSIVVLAFFSLGSSEFCSTEFSVGQVCGGRYPSIIRFCLLFLPLAVGSECVSKYIFFFLSTRLADGTRFARFFCLYWDCSLSVASQRFDKKVVLLRSSVNRAFFFAGLNCELVRIYRIRLTKIVQED